MSIKFEISKHAYAFPTKVLAGNGGEHILNIELKVFNIFSFMLKLKRLRWKWQILKLQETLKKKIF